jgi:hypothetical protein
MDGGRGPLVSSHHGILHRYVISNPFSSYIPSKKTAFEENVNKSSANVAEFTENSEKPDLGTRWFPYSLYFFGSLLINRPPVLRFD